MSDHDDPQFVAFLETQRHRMSGTELRVLDVLTGKESQRLGVPLREIAANLLPFVNTERKAKQKATFSKWKIMAWFRANFHAAFCGA